MLGPKQGSSPVKCIEQYLARKDGTDDFYIMKVRYFKTKILLCCKALKKLISRK